MSSNKIYSSSYLPSIKVVKKQSSTQTDFFKSSLWVSWWAGKWVSLQSASRCYVSKETSEINKLGEFGQPFVLNAQLKAN
jgi:hypothetical protein